MNSKSTRVDVQEKVAAHLVAEVANLNDIQQLLLMFQTSFLQGERRFENTIPGMETEELLKRCQQLHQSRTNLVDEIASEQIHEPIRRNFVSFIREQAATTSQGNDQHQVELVSLQKRVKQASADLRRTAHLLLTKQRHVTLTLSALGVSTVQTRYNAAGERLVAQPSAIMQTRS